MADEERIDTLTGSPNRLRFQELLGERASTDGRPFGVAVIDLDAFGRTLKQLGLISAELVLLTIHLRMKRLIADDAVLARIGRCRLGVLSQPLDDPRLLMAKLDEIREAVRAPINFAGQTTVQTASIGVAFWIPGGPDGDEVLQAAESAMLMARDCGGDQIEVVAPPRRVFKAAQFKRPSQGQV